MPYPTTIYANRTIYNGFKNAFESLGCTFITYTPDDELEFFLDQNQPDMFITASHFFFRKQLDYQILKKYRQKGMLLLTKIDFWDSPLGKLRVNEAPSMKDDTTAKDLITKGLLGDIYYSTATEADGRMKGFREFAKQGFITVPLAADHLTLKPHYQERFAGDILYLGTNLPQKRKFFKEWVLPLKKEYDVRLYGQDWTSYDRMVGRAAKAGQFFNIPGLRSIQKPKFDLNDEADMYASAKILINIHEDYQRHYGGDCNERTYKIPYCGGFQIVDDVAVIREYFKDSEEIVIAKDKDDWFDKVSYYYTHEKEAQAIAEAGRKRVLRDHTYVNRAKQILDLLD